ncbi:MAG: ammonium transporter [Candidatus Nanopelagicales bacterium]|nr:ammonium transporter [Candidatus Nanopelagicales bacterium]
MPDINAGNTAWVLVCAAMVLLMTPALAFFYGGMTRSKSVLNMMMMSFGALGLVSIIWVLWGYSMAFGADVGGGLVGSPTEFFGLKGLMTEVVGAEMDDAGNAVAGTGIPAYAFVAFQAVFAIITVALISGAIADRAKYGAWLVFAVVWATLVYFPVAHWVWGEGGWILDKIEAVDFAGGTVVHINAGVAALALALILGKRIGFGKVPFRPHNVPFVMLGAGLLWFGWFGFNAGSALAADGTAAVAWVMTLVATAAASLAWMATEKIRDGHATSLGAASGVVAGLVAITPACSSVDALGAVVIGIVAGVLCALAVGLKYRWGYDDSLDVVGVHLVGGIVGTLMIGLVAVEEAPAGVVGLFYGGGLDQLGKQAVAAGAVIVFSFVVTLIIGLVIHKTIGFRVSGDDEIQGVDLTTHAETAYELSDATYGGHFAGGGPGGAVKAGVSAAKEGVSA